VGHDDSLFASLAKGSEILQTQKHAKKKKGFDFSTIFFLGWNSDAKNKEKSLKIMRTAEKVMKRTKEN
jgi:hypothetical protein